jgi:hypothetical protein
MKHSLAKKHAKRAISSVIGAVIVFAMMFTVGYGYFYMITQSQAAYQRAIMQSSLLAMQQSEESLVVTVTVNSTTVFSYVNNTGIATSVVAYQITNVSNDKFNDKLLYNQTFGSLNPVVVGQSGFVKLPGGYACAACTNGHFLVKVETSRGNTFIGTYPPLFSSQSLNALSSGAIGDLYMQFSTFTYYNVTTHNQSPNTCPASGANEPTGKASGFCLTTAGGHPGFTIPASIGSSGSLAFSIWITDFNPNQANITLDEYSLIMQLEIHGSSGMTPLTWYIVSNYSTVILQNFNLITLKYGVPVLLLFSAGAPVCAAGQSSGTAGCTTFSGPSTCSGAACPSPGNTAPTFIVTHGCKGLALSACSYNTANYGQNSPYVTMLYT